MFNSSSHTLLLEEFGGEKGGERQEWWCLQGRASVQGLEGGARSPEHPKPELALGSHRQLLSRTEARESLSSSNMKTSLEGGTSETWIHTLSWQTMAIGQERAERSL